MSKTADGYRFCFRQDDSGHWYLLPTEELPEFKRLKDVLDGDGATHKDWLDWRDRFEPCMVSNIRGVSFRDPMRDPACK